MSESSLRQRNLRCAPGVLEGQSAKEYRGRIGWRSAPMVAVWRS